jgi:5-methylcytosine-specific restriction endonuclease McrA
LQWTKDNAARVREIYLKTSTGPVNRYTRQKYRAEKQRGLVWDLTREQYSAFTGKNCYYCGTNEIGLRGVGLDRLDNKKGYTIDNVVPCCFSCNKVKSDVLTQQEMKIAMDSVLYLRSSHNIDLESLT